MKRLHWLWFALLMAVMAVSIPQCLITEGGAFNRHGHQSALDPKGPVAANQYDIFMITLYVTLFIFVTVGGALAWVTWRYRVRKGHDSGAVPQQSHGKPLIEFGLVAVSTLLLVIIAVPTFGGIILKKRVPTDAEGQVMTINVTGYQWWWAFEYPAEGFHTANEIVIPTGRPVRLVLRTNDVIHSFWVPKLAGKVDLMAGQVNDMWIQADVEGTYWGQCAEFCGDSHAYMLFRARAVSPEAYEAWVVQQKRPPAQMREGLAMPAKEPDQWGAAPELVTEGAQLFAANCARCHSLDPAVQTAAPNLAHFASRGTIAAGWLENTPENLHLWIKDPVSVKPGNYMWHGFSNFDREAGEMQMTMEGLKQAALTDPQVDALVAYLVSLK